MSFHLKLNSYCRNQYCCEVLEKSMNVLTRAYAQKHWERWKKTYFHLDCEGHLKIVDLLASGNVEAAEEELKADILDFRELFRAY